MQWQKVTMREVIEWAQARTLTDGQPAVAVPEPTFELQIFTDGTAVAGNWKQRPGFTGEHALEWWILR
jgi:hypothetical protein